MTFTNIKVDYNLLQKAVKQYSLITTDRKKDTLITAIITDLQNGNLDYLTDFPQIADLYFAEILTVEDLNSELIRVLRSLDLPNTHQKIDDLRKQYLASLNSNASKPVTSARQQITTQSLNDDCMTPDQRRMRQNDRLNNKPAKTSSKLVPIAVNSPLLQKNFREIGFADQNGHQYLGDYAAIVLSECWENERLQPNAEIKAYGYYTQAIITIDPEKKETINGQLRDQKIPNTRTVYENSRSKQAGVKINSINHGNAIASYDLPPILKADSVDHNGLTYALPDTVVDTDKILSIDWVVNRVKVLQPQNVKSDLAGRTKPVKQKISWGTRFLPVELPDNVAMGENISIKLGNGKTVKATLVLEVNRQVNLYRGDHPWMRLGQWSQRYDENNNLILTGSWDEKTPVHWYKKLNSVIAKIVASNSKAIRKRFDFSTDIYRILDESIKQSRRFNAKQRKRLKSQAKKYAHKNYNDLPLDVKQALNVLGDSTYDPTVQKALEDNDIPKALNEDRVKQLRRKANDLVLGYYLYKRPVPQKHTIQKS